VFDPGPIKSGPQFNLTMGQPFDLSQYAHVNSLLQMFPEFSRVASQLIYRRTELGVVHDLGREPDHPVSEVGTPACGMEKSRGTPEERRCYIPGSGGVHAQHNGQLNERLRARRAIGIVLVEWGETIQMVEHPADRQGC
jgi:hypothetical protein